MYKITEFQVGKVSIADIRFDPKSRDDIPKPMRALQYIYCTPELRALVFTELDKSIPETINRNTRRPGMSLWRILV